MKRVNFSISPIMVLIILLFALLLLAAYGRAQAKGDGRCFTQRPNCGHYGPYNDGYYGNNSRGWSWDWSYPYSQGPMSNNYLYSPYFPGRGYYEWQRRQESNRSPYKNLQIIPAGQITVVTDPSNAKVLVDGYPLTKEGDTTQISMYTGVHQIEVIAAGYVKYKKQVQVLAGKNILLKITLKKEP